MDANNAAKTITLIPRAVGDLKSIAKRTVAKEGDPWPKELQEAIRFLRDLSDKIEQEHPALVR